MATERLRAKRIRLLKLSMSMFEDFSGLSKIKKYHELTLENYWFQNQYFAKAEMFEKSLFNLIIHSKSNNNFFECCQIFFDALYSKILAK